MTNEELASLKIGMANELTDCVGDHIKLMGVVLRLRDEAAELRHQGPEPYVRADQRPAPEPTDGQSIAERPGYVLKDDHAAPKGLPVAESNKPTKDAIEAHKRGESVGEMQEEKRGAPPVKPNDDKRKDKR